MTTNLEEIPHAVASNPELRASERHELLETKRRRIVLSVLTDARGAIDLADIARAVATQESGGGAVTDGDMKRIERMLHHIDLPILDAVGVIDYDEADHVVYAYGLSSY